MEAWIDFAVGIDDVHQQFFGTVGAHAGQGGADFPSFVAEFVTGRAADGEHGFAIGQIAWLGNDRGQRGNDFIFRFLVWIQLVFHGGGPGGHFTSGVSAKPVGIGRTESHGINGPSLHSIEQNHRPISALEQRFKSGGPRFDWQLAISGGQHWTDSGISRFTKSHDQALLETRRIVSQQLAFQSRHDRGTGRANAQQATGGAHPNHFVRPSIAERSRELPGNPVDDGGKITASRIPLGRQRQRRAAGPAFQQAGQRSLQGRRHRRCILERFVQRLEDPDFQVIGGGWFARQRDHERGGGGGVIRFSQRGDQTVHERREAGWISRFQSRRDAGRRIAGRRADGRAFLVVVVKLRPCSNQGFSHGIVQRAGRQRPQGRQSDRRLRIVQQRRHRARVLTVHFSHQGRIPADRRAGVAVECFDPGWVHAFHRSQRPHRRNFGIRLQPLHRSHRSRLHVRRLDRRLGHQSMGRQPHMAVRMRQRLQHLTRLALDQIRYGQLFRLLVLDFPDAAEIMVAVRTNRRVDPVVVRTTGVVVNDRLIVKIRQIHAPVRTDTDLNRPPPHVLTANEFRFFTPRQFARRITRPGRRQTRMVHHIDRRLRREIITIVFRRPSAAIIDHRARRRRERSDPVDLHIRQLLPPNKRE